MPLCFVGIFSSNFRSFYSAGHWQGIHGIRLGSEKNIVQAWLRSLRGQSASVSHLALPLHPPGQPRAWWHPLLAGQPAQRQPTSEVRVIFGFTWPGPSLLTGETEDQGNQPSSSKSCLQVTEQDPNSLANVPSYTLGNSGTKVTVTSISRRVAASY